MSFTIVFEYDRPSLLEERSRESQGSNRHGPIRYIYELEMEVKEAGDRLCQFIDPHSVLDSPAGSRWPLVIFAFGESHILTELPKHCDWTLFPELCHALHAIVKQPMFSLFLATAGNSHLSSPEIKSDPGTRVINHSIHPLGPITEISFDDIAYPAKEGTVSLSHVVTANWISHLTSTVRAFYIFLPRAAWFLPYPGLVPIMTPWGNIGTFNLGEAEAVERQV